MQTQHHLERMGRPVPRIEIVHKPQRFVLPLEGTPTPGVNPQPWHVRFIGANGETVWWTESYFDVRDAEHAIILLAEALGMRSPFIGTTPAIAPHHMLVEADTEEDPVVERLPIMRVEVGP